MAFMFSTSCKCPFGVRKLWLKYINRSYFLHIHSMHCAKICPDHCNNRKLEGSQPVLADKLREGIVFCSRVGHGFSVSCCGSISEVHNLKWQSLNTSVRRGVCEILTR